MLIQQHRTVILLISILIAFCIGFFAMAVWGGGYVFQIDSSSFSPSPVDDKPLS